jgi:membrane fusion protein, multidrug efflux system
MKLRHRTIGFVVLVTAGVLSAGWIGCAGHEPNEATAKELPTADVRVEVIKARRDAGVFHAVGRVKNSRESTIASKVMGKVSAVRVAAGEVVKEGQLLIAIGDHDVSGQVGQAKGALAQAEAARVIAKQMLDRIETLRKTNSVTQAQYDKAVFDHESALGAVEQARGALRTAQSYLQETRVVAPFSGRVIDTLIEEGEMASPGYPLVRIEGDGDLEFEATVTAQDINTMKVGQVVTVELDAGRNDPRSIPGKIYEIVPAMDRVTHSNTVRVHLDETEGLRSGMFGRASFSRMTGSCPGVLVDEDRLVRTGQLTGVFIVGGDDRVRLRLVREGRHSDGKVEVLSGLTAGDRLIMSDITGLKDGQPAKVVK